MSTHIGADMLRKAADTITERQKVYGSPNENFKAIAAFWTAWLVARYGQISTTQLDEIDVAMMMDDVKKARLAKTPDHPDSWIDKAGYAACGLQVATKPAEEVGERTEPHTYTEIVHEPHCATRHGLFGRACDCGAAKKVLDRLSEQASKANQ